VNWHAGLSEQNLVQGLGPLTLGKFASFEQNWEIESVELTWRNICFNKCRLVMGGFLRLLTVFFINILRCGFSNFFTQETFLGFKGWMNWEFFKM
jgi:hypothetical protein